VVAELYLVFGLEIGMVAIEVICPVIVDKRAEDAFDVIAAIDLGDDTIASVVKGREACCFLNRFNRMQSFVDEI
jgi:hypothetical protein